jgi:type III secretory pathway component EscS
MALVPVPKLKSFRMEFVVTATTICFTHQKDAVVMLASIHLMESFVQKATQVSHSCVTLVVMFLCVSAAVLRLCSHFRFFTF